MNKDEEKKNDNVLDEKTDDSNTEILDDKIDDTSELGDPDYVTREINLDDLYDGAINNTVVIDPVTNSEILLTPKKPNYTFIGIILAIIVLLVLYYVNNKTDLGKTTKDVKPKTKVTTTIDQSNLKAKIGTLNCTYSSKSDAETQTVTYTANYKGNKVIKSNFNYVDVSNSEGSSAVSEDLKNQYEKFYINNAAITGNKVSFEKNTNGFTFNNELTYSTANFDGITITDGQTVLFVKPSLNDTIESLQKAYQEKGFTCINSEESSEE